MNQDLDALISIRDLSTSDFELFQSALRTLTSKTFIIRGIEKDRELYLFAIRNFALFEAWFLCMDASIVKDESLGIIAFRGPGMLRFHFSREEICAVLTLRLIYEDKKHEVSLTDFPVTSVEDFKQKYKALSGEEIKKTNLNNVLRRLSSCKLIAVDSPDYTDSEALIKLYPGIPFSISRQALDDAIILLEEKDIEGIDEDTGEVDS
ncbi:MAG: DUF4194 domain-containing protein [Treponema sp.]|jgi:hypothetical protein|nr:DUF4194 domain-containing protein [Treponema sp.]